MNEQDDFKQKVAKNLVYFRKKNRLTQLELAEKINYSDKAISKWERAESIPDLFVLQTLANLYNISVDNFISGEKARQSEETKIQKIHKHRKLLITVLSFCFVWFVATVIFVLLSLILGLDGKWWLAFIYAIPVSMIVLLVFNCMWGKVLSNILPVSGISWGVCLSIYLSINLNNLWLLFIVAASFQILIILWFVYLKIMKKYKSQSL